MNKSLDAMKERLQKAIPSFPPDATALMIDNYRLIAAIERMDGTLRVIGADPPISKLNENALRGILNNDRDMANHARTEAWRILEGT